MFVRCAYFIGQPFPGKEAEFHERLVESLKLYMGFQNIRSAQYLRAAQADDGAPGIYATLQLCFDSEAALQDALATPHRQEMRAYFANRVTPLFEGAVKHINHHLEQQGV